MNKQEKIAFFSFPFILFLGLFFALVGGQYGNSFKNFSVFSLIVAIVFLIQFVVFIPAMIFQTEKYFDITGSLTYIIAALAALFVNNNIDARSLLLSLLVIVWAFRLGLFLFKRIHKAGKDARFDNMKLSFIRWLNAWNLQGLWIVFTSAAALTAVSSKNKVEFGILGTIGLVIWIIGFGIEVVSDNQKSKFNSNPINKGNFMKEGLWSRSRHPNYFGEILLWFGIAIISLPVLKGVQLFTLISPVFVYILLTKISGIPILEKKAEKKWGGQLEYEAYKNSTPGLIPKFFS